MQSPRTARPPSRDLTARAHAWLLPVLQPGATALDATCGNGHDTLFLARAVAPQGQVHAIDIQTAAIERARSRLDAAGYSTSVQWHSGDHAELGQWLPPLRLDAAMFNLGWLPRSDSPRVTQPATTRAALDAALALLRPGGRLTVLCYRGHPGGTEEAEAVEQWQARAGAHRLALEPLQPAPGAPCLHVLAAPP